MFWLYWFYWKLKIFKGSSTRNLGKYKIDAGILEDVINTQILESSKEFKQYSYTYPNLSKMHCYIGLCIDISFQDIMFDSIGFLRRKDKVTVYTKFSTERGTETWVDVLLRNQEMKNIVLDWYAKHPSSVNRDYLADDLKIVQDFMNYSADRVIDNILKNTLHR